MRGFVFDEDAAREIASRLGVDGYAARVTRARLAGEDDDEDQPWAVDTDAPRAALELLLDANDGWLEVDPPPGSGPREGVVPVALPDAPRRRHR